MSMLGRATAAVLSQLMMAADGAFYGISVAYISYCCIRKYRVTSSAIRKIRDAPSVQPSDLPSVLSDVSSPKLNCEGGKLVIVRGSVEVITADKGNWKSLMEDNPVASKNSGEKYAILQRTETCIYNDWKGVFGWSVDLRNMLSVILNVILKKDETSSTTMVPFILVEEKTQPYSDYVVVNMEGSNHPLPLTTVYQHLEPISSTPYTFLQSLCGIEYPVAMLYEEKILPLGKDIAAVGICYPKNGTIEIKSCKDLPYFLSTLTKNQIVADLSFKAKVLMWSGLVFGTVAICVLGYSVGRNWTKWKEYRRQRQNLLQNNSTSTTNGSLADVLADEEPEEIPDGELCVICLTRRRRSAFVPCGHLVCCQRCALSVEREVSPKCPLCRQIIRSSVRIYDFLRICKMLAD